MEDYGDGDEPMHPKDASRLSQEDLHKEVRPRFGTLMSLDV